MKDASARPDVHQITRTSLPVRVCVDGRESERGVLGIIHRAPTPLDKGEIKGVERRDAHLDFNQHGARWIRTIGLRVGVGDAEVRVGCDANADSNATPLFPARDSRDAPNTDHVVCIT